MDPRRSRTVQITSNQHPGGEMLDSKMFPYKPLGIAVGASSSHCEDFKHVLHKLDNLEAIDILSLFSTLFKVPLADESLEGPTVTSLDKTTESEAHKMDMRVDVEDRLGAELSSNPETTASQMSKRVSKVSLELRR